VPFKTNADRRHHIPKQRHQVTNWREYDAALRQRGSLTVLCGRPSKGNRGRRLARASHYFLRGLIADEQGDRVVLQTAVISLSPTADPADAAELRARLDHNAALALKAVDLRRTALGYRGMARALALAAQLTSDPNTAADLYLRAGRSAAAQGDTTIARTWLAKVRDLARDPAVRAAATAVP
jgi:hypothetical protein